MLIENGDILVETRGCLGLVTLNRPQALNALNGAMVDGLQGALASFAADAAIRHVAIRGAGGKAFSAGGDIRLMHDLGKAGRQAEALDFWAREYRLNAYIKRYLKPCVALIDGIVMGGGVGVSLHGSHRFAGPNALFAMPEVGIGFFPDVGASHALPRLAGACGMYLALTGARVRQADMTMLGLATHAVRGGIEDEIVAALAAGEAPDAVGARFAVDPGASPLAARRATLDRCFGQPSLRAVLDALGAAGDDAFATEALARMRKGSPTSMAIAFEQMRRGAALDFDAAMRMEFRIVSRLAYGHDFYEGVRALIIDKDNAPVWAPASIDALDMGAIAGHFAPLEHELRLAGEQG